MTTFLIFYALVIKSWLQFYRIILHAFLNLFFFHKFLKLTKSYLSISKEIKKLINYYCSISLLFYLSKFLKKLIKSRFIMHGVLHDFQCGFRQNHSVTQALLDVTVLTYDSIQNKCYTALLLMVLLKTFDTLSHKILLHKWQYCSIRGPAYTLVESYLSSRNHIVSINNISSSLENIKIGVSARVYSMPLALSYLSK